MAAYVYSRIIITVTHLFMIDQISQKNKRHTDNEIESFTWDDSYAIARKLQERHQGVNLEDISIETILRWTLELEEFRDDPDLVNDSILLAIYQEWFEEVFTL